MPDYLSPLGSTPSGPAPLGCLPPGRGRRRGSAARAEPNAAPSAGPSSGGLAPPSLPAAVTHGEAEAEAAAPAAAAAAAAAAAPAERVPEQAAALRTRSPRRRALRRPRAAPSYFSSVTILPLELNICLPEVNFQKQESPELGQGDEPRGSTGQESGGDVHSTEGPRAAHAEEDGVKSDRQRGRIPAHLRRGSQQPAQSAATALHRPGCRRRGDGIFQVGDGRPEAVAESHLEHPKSYQGPRDLWVSSTG